MIHQRKIIKAIAYAILLCFTSLTGAQPLYAIPANTQLPTGPDGTVGKPEIMAGVVQDNISGNTLTLTQNGTTSVLKWGDFSIGADAAVNFVGSDGKTFTGMNSLNYVTGKDAPISEIYGQLTALGGNIFIANPAGVQIGNSAQINVGSLYVTNKDVGEALSGLNQDSTTEQIAQAINGLSVAATNAELMSLGSIISTKNNVTFDGNRIVIDTERLYTNEDGTKMRGLDASGTEAGANAIVGLTIKTEETNDVILGYDGTDENHGDVVFTLNTESTEFDTDKGTSYHGYQWVRDLFALQDIAKKENLGGWYALRNSIDASYTVNMDGGKGFTPIGSVTSAGSSNDWTTAFSGRFDGLDYDIFGLTINRSNSDNGGVGLFGALYNAYARNVTINSGSITGSTNVGSIAGRVNEGSVVENIVNTADVSGTVNVGGIIGVIQGYSQGTPTERSTELRNLRNVGTISGKSTVGGIVGSASNVIIDGEVYNLGNVTGSGNNSQRIGGIVGYAMDTNIGSDGFQIYNQAAVTGDYNVGGIAGYLNKSSVTNVANHGTIMAEGYSSSYSDGNYYQYHTAETNKDNIDGTQVFNGKNPINKLDGDLVTVAVNVANAGGIVGSANDATIENVLNDGDVATATKTNEKGEDYHIAGNVGGIVGRAQGTTIIDATNRENSVAGAHNVGGVAGLLYDSSVTNGTNDGGDITGTGAIYEDKFVEELVRPVKTATDGETRESFNIGNIGGIAGYMYDSKMEKKTDRLSPSARSSTTRRTEARSTPS